MPAPPVARMVCGARKVSTSSVLPLSAYRPRQRGAPPSPRRLEVITSTSVWSSSTVIPGVRRTVSISWRCTAAPVASVACTMRRALCPPSRVRCSSPFSSENGTPSDCSQAMAAGAFSTTWRVAGRSLRPAPAISVSLMWASKLSSSASTAAMPPWAWLLAPSSRLRLVSTATRCVGASSSAAVRPARPLPTMSTSKSCNAMVKRPGKDDGSAQAARPRAVCRPAAHRSVRRLRPG